MPRASSDNRPWVGIATLMAAAVATLIGIGRGFDPDVVLLRAAGAAVVVAVLAGLFKKLVVRFLRSQ
jgi:hypothetical protein